jgi:hypothetical protein
MFARQHPAICLFVQTFFIMMVALTIMGLIGQAMDAYEKNTPQDAASDFKRKISSI